MTNLGHVYVAELEDGVVKVGQSRKPEQRMRSYQGLRRSWTSAAHESYRDTEVYLVIYGERHGTVARGIEYFNGLDFNAVVAYAEHLLAGGLPEGHKPLPEGTVEPPAHWPEPRKRAFRIGAAAAAGKTVDARTARRLRLLLGLTEHPASRAS